MGGYTRKPTHAEVSASRKTKTPRAGRLLGELLRQHEWVSRNYLLAMLVVANTSHGVDNSRLREIRSLSASLADGEPMVSAAARKDSFEARCRRYRPGRTICEEKRPADRAGFEKLLQLMRAEYAEAETAANESFEKGAERSTRFGGSSPRPVARTKNGWRSRTSSWSCSSVHFFTSRLAGLAKNLCCKCVRF